MPSLFDANIAKVERTLSRTLTSDELRLLRLWDLTAKSTESYNPAPDPTPEMSEQSEQYEGRFKVGFSKNQYELFFVCSTVMFRPISVENRDDLLAFLIQDPLNLDEPIVQQALAAAQNFRPTIIPQAVTLQERFLRSIGFVQVKK